MSILRDKDACKPVPDEPADLLASGESSRVGAVADQLEARIMHRFAVEVAEAIRHSDARIFKKLRARGV
jgi:hypothetical protein